jgi:hypothetical protein
MPSPITSSSPSATATSASGVVGGALNTVIGMPSPATLTLHSDSVNVSDLDVMALSDSTGKDLEEATSGRRT